MKRLFFLLNLAFCVCAFVHAQSFTQHIQEKRQGKANVSVTQSHEIEELVNNANVSARAQEPVAERKTATAAPKNNTPTKKQNNQEPAARKPSTTQHNGDSAHSASREKEPASHSEPAQHSASREPAAPHTENRKSDTADREPETPAVDMSKKVMRRSYKVNGYRVQVFAGGNSRADKIKAQNAGNAVKQAFPNQPVYVHFYSPRWICRVGNFRSYEEANAVMHQVKKMGYKQACIVSGKITVAY